MTLVQEHRTLVLRPDTRPGVGLGHIARSLGLATAWKRAKGNVRLVVDPDAYGRLDDRISELAKSAGLPTPELAIGDAAAGLVTLVEPDSASWIVLDGYDYEPDIQREVRRLGRLLVVDDQASLGSYDADFVLDQNPGTHLANYEGIAPTRVLRGTRFVTLRKDAIGQPEGSPDEQCRVGILAGGSPSPATQSLLLKVIARLAPDVPLRLIAMPWANDHVGGVEVRPFVAPLFKNLDRVSFVVTPSGATAWELAALGVPSIVFAAAQNQLPVGEAVASSGAGVFAGLVETEGIEQVVDRVVDAAGSFRNNSHQLDAARASGRRLIDGRGADRVVAQLRGDDLQLRAVEWSDADLLLEWANDKTVRAAAFSSNEISQPEHGAWLRGRLATQGQDNWHWIASLHGTPVGQVRFDRRNDALEISLTIAQEARGFGLGAPLIAAGTRRVAEQRRLPSQIVAQVKHINEPSMRSFMTAGYVLTGFRSSSNNDATPDRVDYETAELVPDGEEPVAQLVWKAETWDVT